MTRKFEIKEGRKKGGQEEMKFPDRRIRENNIVEIGGRIKKTQPFDWGGFVTLDCEHSAMMFSHLDIQVVKDDIRELLWLPDQHPVLLGAYVLNYSGINEKGKPYSGWRLEVDKIISDRSTSPDEEARFDQNMVRLVGTVIKKTRMTGSRLKVVLLCKERYHQPCTAEVVMHKDTLQDVTEGMNLGVLAYVEMGNRKNPQTKKWYPYKSIKVVYAWPVG
jgi:hypothetical protein